MEEARSRKLAPIYNALESGNWRQAVRLCEKRELEKWMITKALKANGLWRLQRYDESLRLCLEVQAAVPTDEDTLQAMSFNYRMMNRRDQVTKMFEAAVKVKPSDASLVKECFMCYIRAKQYLKAQQTATKLYKLDSKGGKFIIWAAATMLIQAERKEVSAGPTTLPLAERMAVKVLQEKAAKGSRPVGEELRLYLDILKLQGKHRDALDALDSFDPAATTTTASTEGGALSSEGKGPIEDESSLEDGTIVNMRELDQLELKAELYEKLGAEDDLDKAATVLQLLIEQSPDQWSYYVSLINLAGKRHGLSEGGERADIGQWPPSLMSTLRLIRRLQQQHARWRGPFLAEMELLKRAMQWFGSDSQSPEIEPEDGVLADDGDKDENRNHNEDKLWGLLCGCVSTYMTKFSAKLCCFRDMRPYLCLFAIASRERTVDEGLGKGFDSLKAFFRKEAEESMFVEGVNDDPQEGGNGAPAPLEQDQREDGVRRLHRYICACQARQLLGDLTACCGDPGGASVEGLDNDHLREKQYRDFVQELMTQYRVTLHLNLGGEGGQREVQHGDELVLMAAQVILKLLCRGQHGSGDDSGREAKAYLGKVEAACLLEAAISCSPYNHHMKILAIDVYRQLGSFARAIALFNDLDVKQIQVDTLSYLIVGPSQTLGLFEESQRQCRAVKVVHRNCQYETADHVARAFDRGNYSNGAEIDRFQREKLDVSLQLAMASSGKIVLDILLNHSSHASAARYLQEEALSTEGAEGVAYAGDKWLDSLKSNLDYFVQADRCCVQTEESEKFTEVWRRDRLLASLKRRVLANQTLMLALKGDPARDVDSKAKELEAAVGAAAAIAVAGDRRLVSVAPAAARSSNSSVNDVSDALAAVAISDEALEGGEADRAAVSILPWDLFSHTSRALAFLRQGIGMGGDGTAPATPSAGGGDTGSKLLGSAAEALVKAAEKAKACRMLLNESNKRRHIVVVPAVVERGGAAAQRVAHQNQLPLRPEWLRIWSKWLADGGVYTCLVLQAIGVELPADKKKKGKGKAKGKGKKAAAAGGAADASSGNTAVSRCQDALSVLGGEIVGFLKALAATLKAEVAAKSDSSCQTEALSHLLKGHLGLEYQPVIGMLWEGSGERWCEEGTVGKAVATIGEGQATSCQRLLRVVIEHLAALQRWEK